MDGTISEWLEFSKKRKKSIIEIKPKHFGKQYRNLSEEIDDVLYKYRRPSYFLNPE